MIIALNGISWNAFQDTSQEALDTPKWLSPITTRSRSIPFFLFILSIRRKVSPGGTSFWISTCMFLIFQRVYPWVLYQDFWIPIDCSGKFNRDLRGRLYKISSSRIAFEVLHVMPCRVPSAFSLRNFRDIYSGISTAVSDEIFLRFFQSSSQDFTRSHSLDFFQRFYHSFSRAFFQSSYQNVFTDFHRVSQNCPESLF